VSKLFAIITVIGVILPLDKMFPVETSTRDLSHSANPSFNGSALANYVAANANFLARLGGEA
jgi:hypothetical protein